MKALFNPFRYIAGVKALEEGSFRGAAMDAVSKAYKRTLELGK